MINSVILKKVAVGLYPFSDGLNAAPRITAGDILILGKNKDLESNSQYELLIHKFASDDSKVFFSLLNLHKLRFDGWNVYSPQNATDATDFMNMYNNSPVADPEIDSRLWSN